MITLKEKFNKNRKLVGVETNTYSVELQYYHVGKPLVTVSHKSSDWDSELAKPVMSIEDGIMRVRITMMGELSDERLKLLKEQLEESQKLCLYLNAYLRNFKK